MAGVDYYFGSEIAEFAKRIKENAERKGFTFTDQQYTEMSRVLYPLIGLNPVNAMKESAFLFAAFSIYTQHGIIPLTHSIIQDLYRSIPTE